MISALAVVEAGDDGIAHAELINGITRDGEVCTTFADCVALIEAGTDIDYVGATSVELVGPGESAGVYREVEFKDGAMNVVKFR